MQSLYIAGAGEGGNPVPCFSLYPRFPPSPANPIPRESADIHRPVRPTLLLKSTLENLAVWITIRGIGLTRRLSATGTRLQAIGMLTLEPERLKNRLATTRTRSPEMDGTVHRNAQAACNFSFSASKSSPFFQSVSVMAAILRASLRRAMVGLMPLASEA